MQEKTCTKCKASKVLDDFPFSKKTKDGRGSWCRKCVSDQNSTKQRLNPEKKRQQSRQYYYDNKTKMIAQSIEYQKLNKEKIFEYNKEYGKARRKVDNLFRLKTNLRGLIGQTFRKGRHNKRSKTVTLLGCSIEDFKKYIESKWQSWMNWENYGRFNGQEGFGWDLDHIIPISTAKTVEDLEKLNHYTNFQPLCSKINRHIKANNIG